MWSGHRRQVSFRVLATRSDECDGRHMDLVQASDLSEASELWVSSALSAVRVLAPHRLLAGFSNLAFWKRMWLLLTAYIYIYIYIYMSMTRCAQDAVAVGFNEV